MSDRLDEIRERYECSRKIPRVQQFGHSAALNDIGYLLGQLTEHPASEPPPSHKMVVVDCGYGRLALAAIDFNGQWASGETGKNIDYVKCWGEMPPVFQRCEVVDNRLDKIRERFANIKQADDLPGEWVGDMMAKTYLQDMAYLLGLTEERPASEPPDDSRRVQVWVYDNWHIGKYQPVNGWHVNTQDNLPVKVWRELSPVPQGYTQRTEDD